jgi:hypothetical protein
LIVGVLKNPPTEPTPEAALVLLSTAKFADSRRASRCPASNKAVTVLALKYNYELW